MLIEFRAPATPDEYVQFVRVDGRIFGNEYTEEDIADIPKRLPADRVIVAVDTELDRVVGGGGAYAFDLTLPGGAAVPVAGVTWVSTETTHRRRGVLRATMDALHRVSIERGEVAQILTASEGGIYERFGYGIASQRYGTTINTREARLRPDRPSAGRVEVCVDPNVAIEASLALWNDRCARHHGEVSLDRPWWEFLLGPISRRIEGGPFHSFVHRSPNATIDGVAHFRLEAKWDPATGPDGTVRLLRLLAATPAAHADLWAAVLSVDIARRVTLRHLCPDDPLHWLVENRRAIATASVRDDLWVRPSDIARVLTARTYECDGDIVIELEGERWSLHVADGVGSCETTERDATVTMSRAMLGAALLGGANLLVAASAGSVRASSETSLIAADRIFRTATRAELQHAF